MDEKIHLQPELVLTHEAYQRFREELEEYETWLESVRFKRLSIAGRIKSVKPWFERTLLPGESHTRLWGYLLVFKKGFMGLESFEDTFYVRISERLMRSFQFVPKMKVEMVGEIREDRGRIVVHRPGKIEIIKKGWGLPWSRERALVGVKTASLLEEQPGQCLACRWGALADVIDRREREEQRYRYLYCLKGVADPDGCYVRGFEHLRKVNIV